MTLDEFIVCKKVELERFRIRWARGVKLDEYPVDLDYAEWGMQVLAWMKEGDVDERVAVAIEKFMEVLKEVNRGDE